MFGGLRQNSIFYVLEKGENPTLKIGQVVSVSNPQPKFGTYQAGLYNNTEQVVDVTVKTNDTQLEFKQLPTTHTIANSGDVVVSDSRDAMLNEVEGMKRTSQNILDSVDFHQNVVKSCDSIIETLNPNIAKEKANEMRIGAMEEKMGGIESTLTNIQDMLSVALNKPKTK